VREENGYQKTGSSKRKKLIVRVVEGLVVHQGERERGRREGRWRTWRLLGSLRISDLIARTEAVP
jgi:hypothetical protein